MNFQDWNFAPSSFTIKSRAESYALESQGCCCPAVPPGSVLSGGATAVIAELGAGRGSLDQQGELQILLAGLWDAKRTDLGKRND